LTGGTAKETQSLARHTDPRITMNIYGKTWAGRLNELAEAVAEHIRPESAQAAILKTGTDDAPLTALLRHRLTTETCKALTCNGFATMEAAGIEPLYQPVITRYRHWCCKIRLFRRGVMVA
jgi:hypothetical protein